MKIFKTIVVIFFIVLLILAVYGFDINAVKESATSRPFMFSLTVLFAGLLGWISVNKFNN